MVQKVSSVFVVYRRKTLTGSPDPTHANGMDKPCIDLIPACTWQEVVDGVCVFQHALDRGMSARGMSAWASAGGLPGGVSA